MRPHGDVRRYWQGCRCTECRRAYNQRQNMDYPANRQGEVPHGTAAGYSGWKCRCDACKDAHTYQRDEAAARRFLSRFGLDLHELVKTSA